MILETEALAKRYRRRWALYDCTLAVPESAIVGLVGPNGAGKTTLLQLIVGLLGPTAGAVRVLGGTPDAAMRSGRVGFVAQDAPTYAGLTVADHLSMGGGLNPHRWDAPAAAERVDRLGLRLRQRAGRLSGGQRAQLALTLALSKRPDLLVLDEPVASLDPLARRAFLDETAAAATATGTAVVLSTHLVADLAHVCTHVVVLAGGRIRLAAAIAELCTNPAELERVVLDELGRASGEGHATR
ncbi:ABC transporter ATP-binding protein [Actinopolymorpha pittospori]|uniref:ABC-2 type transport system ATP-binding protein n=1 Tax=Actinopolymorpha pittospori TaxID=648752 RepID=A0A927MNW8_9ACTN|nr:ABC transporter ATP-binding protein [Actinopolymorpha pittospori]MBE1604161.1 ABC-2 type transport system ATP-binding protein [Actinopolymorpha pittospori]